MKAVIWTDVFQAVVMIAGMLAIVISVRHFQFMKLIFKNILTR